MTHVDDVALVRLLDGEGTATERARLAAHLGSCAACEERRGLLAEASRELSLLLDRADSAPPAFALRCPPLRPWRAWPAAAAAVVLVLSTVTLFAAPVRSWIVGRWTVVHRLLHAAPVLSPTQRPGGAVSFIPASDVLVVRVATRQAEGSLLLETTATPTASAEVRSAGEREGLIVLPDELRIANTPTSRATYRLTVPTRLRRVVIVIDAEPPVFVTPALAGEGRNLDLRALNRP